jgi:hypothetical protein
VTVSGTYAYVASQWSGLQVMDITNPASPRVVGSVDTPGGALAVAVSGAHACVANLHALVILPAQCETPTGVGEGGELASKMPLRVYPNPGAGQTFIDFWTRNAGRVQARAYDVAGRCVCQLSDGILSAGGHHLLWDGHDENGGPVAAGIYFIRVSTAEGSATARFVMVR